MKYRYAFVLLGGLVLLGCSNKPDTYPVRGTVTFDGQLVPDGDILFVDVENKVGPDYGKIKDGKFDFQAKKGKKKIEIRAEHMVKLPSGRTGLDGQTEGLADYIPERYNAKTELTAEITSSGSNQLEFNLTSSGK